MVEFEVLYTKHITRRSKIWQDGKMKYDVTGPTTATGTLYAVDSYGSTVATIGTHNFQTADEKSVVQPGREFEFAHTHLIQVLSGSNKVENTTVNMPPPAETTRKKPSTGQTGMRRQLHSGGGMVLRQPSDFSAIRDDRITFKGNQMVGKGRAITQGNTNDLSRRNGPHYSAPSIGTPPNPTLPSMRAGTNISAALDSFNQGVSMGLPDLYNSQGM
eukprot:GHVO01031444.1.p1 GENE.GHVO01031444.1~~GHVO01031444.1.p1  ORF type:complete len:216 (+),score=34.34 GHVO01031444.1:14-661(+)